MTAQLEDSVRYGGEAYAIAGIAGEPLFTPEDVGITPVMLHTACYRGYVVTYEVAEGELRIAELVVNAEGGHYPKINGVEATPMEGPFWQPAFHYEGIGLRQPFTGGLLIAKDFMRERYAHMGFQHPTAYGTVIELLLDDGRVLSELDHSEKIAELRATIDKRGPASMADDDVLTFIKDAFSRDYGDLV